MQIYFKCESLKITAGQYLLLHFLDKSFILHQAMAKCNTCGNQYEGDHCSSCKNKKQQDCKYFLEGSCKYGDDCKYNHPHKNKKEDCKFYLQGECKFGKDCKYNHPLKKQKQDCKYYLQGQCKYGKDCKYNHPKKQKQDCKYFLKGQCKYGDNCKWNHPFTKKKKNCKDFMKGECKNGDNCDYNHPPVSGKCKNCGANQFVDKKLKICYQCHQNISQI